jgi:hypothetical protein
MIKMEFDLSAFETREEKANALMQYIVNRAAGFNKTLYTQVYTEFEDTAIGAVAYELSIILATFTGITIYTPRNIKKCRFYKKNSSVKPKFNFQLKRIKDQINTMFWDCKSTHDNELMDNYWPKLFYGFDTAEIKEIAEALYGWED